VHIARACRPGGVRLTPSRLRYGAQAARRESSLRSCPSAAAASSADSIACNRGIHRHCWFERHGSRGTNSRRGIAALPFRLRGAAPCSERPPPIGTPTRCGGSPRVCAVIDSRCSTMEARALRDSQPGDSVASSSEPGHERCKVEGCEWVSSGSRCRGRALGRRPFGARRCTAKPEIGRSDSSPRVRSARSVHFEPAMPVYAAIAGDGTSTTRGGSGRT